MVYLRCLRQPLCQLSHNHCRFEASFCCMICITQNKVVSVYWSKCCSNWWLLQIEQKFCSNGWQKAPWHDCTTSQLLENFVSNRRAPQSKCFYQFLSPLPLSLSFLYFLLSLSFFYFLLSLSFLYFLLSLSFLYFLLSLSFSLCSGIAFTSSTLYLGYRSIENNDSSLS